MLRHSRVLRGVGGLSLALLAAAAAWLAFGRTMSVVPVPPEGTRKPQSQHQVFEGSKVQRTRDPFVSRRTRTDFHPCRRIDARPLYVLTTYLS
jgi:hypothetical protein